MAPRLICLPSVLCPDWRTCRKGCPAHSSRASSIPSLLRWCPVILPRLTGQVSRHIPSATDRKSTRLNSSHSQISYAVFCLKKKKSNTNAVEDVSQKAYPNIRLAPLNHRVLNNVNIPDRGRHVLTRLRYRQPTTASPTTFLS